MKSYLQDLYQIAVERALPEVCLLPYLEKIDASNGLCVLGAGKASVKMAETTQRFFGEQCFGAVVTRHGYTDETRIGNIDILKGGHPIPDEGSAFAAQRILELASQSAADVPVLFLISGGGSALMTLPIDGVSLEDKIEVNKFLLGCGASIHEINTVRKQLSQVKGGKLAKAINGPHYSLIISDVVGDDPSFIASGPTVQDATSHEQALWVLKKYHHPDYDKIASLFAEMSLRGSEQSTVTPTDHTDQALTPLTLIPTTLTPRTNSAPAAEMKGEVSIIANAKQSIDAAIMRAKDDGWDTRVIDYQQEGEAKTVAKAHAEIALAALKEQRPIILFSGGELTVSLNNTLGAGGPNQEYALALAIALNGQKGICALACDTDGIDGNRDVAGAYVDETTLARCQALHLVPQTALEQNNTFALFETLGDLIITGPTHTNVNDFRAIMINPTNKAL